MVAMLPSDAMAFSELQGFLHSLDTTVSAYYVGGGDETLAKWAASFICRSDEARGLQNLLLDDETQWELYLRRAGINVYAAQVVAAMIKAPDGARPEDAGRYGLAAFVRMSPEERIARFESVFGGRRVLSRVSRAIDRPWS